MNPTGHPPLPENSALSPSLVFEHVGQPGALLIAEEILHSRTAGTTGTCPVGAVAD